jgi:hypothetical protein
MQITSGVKRITGTAWMPFLIFLIPCLIFWPTLNVGFVSDDYLYHAAFSNTLLDFLEKTILVGSNGIMTPEFFRPVGIISLKLDYLFWGPDPVGFHLTNILLHSINAVLLFYLVGSFGIRRVGAFAAGLFFGLYPLNSEPVSWVSGRFDLLATTFILLMLHAWCIGRMRNDLRWMIPSIIMFLLGTLSKENAVAGLALLPLTDWLLRMRTKKEWGTAIGWQWKWYIVFAAVAIVVIWLRVPLFGDIGGYGDEHAGLAFFGVPFTILWSNFFNENLKMLFSPVSRILWSEWGAFPQQFLIVIAAVFYLGLLAALVRITVAAIRTDRSMLVISLSGIAWIILMMIPVLPIEGVQDSLSYARFLYLSIAGLALLTGVAVDLGFNSGKIVRRITLVIFILTLLASSTVLTRHNLTWIEAGQIASRINTTMQTFSSQLTDNSTIFTIEHPLLWKGAGCSPRKYNSYLEYRYGCGGINVVEMPVAPDDIDIWWSDLSESYARPAIGFVWNESTETIDVLPLFIPDEIPTVETTVAEPVSPDHGVGEPEEINVFPEPG